MGMSQILKMVIMFLTLLFLLQLASTSDACNAIAMLMAASDDQIIFPTSIILVRGTAQLGTQY